MTRTRIHLLLSLIAFVLAFPAGALDPFLQQPRISIENGHLILRAAEGKNITLLSSGSGKIWINKADVTAFTGQMNSFQIGNEMSSYNVGPVIATAQDLENKMATLSTIAAKVEKLEANVTALLNKVDQLIGSGRAKITNGKLQSYMGKVKTLERKVNELKQLLSANECNSNPCSNGGTCIDTYNSFICRCPPNWKGLTCQEDVNECAEFAGTSFGCQNGATCYNSPGSYRCECPTDWHGIHCTERHDDCSSASHQELCGHGICVNEKRVVPGQPKYHCICNEGWTHSSSSPACTEDVNECAGDKNPCSRDPPVTCINLQGSYHCGPCPNGYTGNGHYCRDINECETNNGGCSTNPHVRCINTLGSRYCESCPPGYVGDGTQCNFVGVCGVNRGGCHPLATCIENTAITGTYRECRCPPGYSGSGEGITGCVQSQAMSCTNNPCHNGTCQVTATSFYCVCFPGYTGTLCDQRADPCYSSPCQNGGTCISNGDSFTCSCTQQYEGPTCLDVKRLCGGVLSGNNGTLKYPEEGAYRPERTCAWLIVVDSNKVVNVTFDEFHVAGASCTADFLQINDDFVSTNSHNARRFCANQSPVGQSIQTIRNRVYLMFHTTSATPDGMKFSLTWNATDAVCGEVLEEAEYGTVNSPGYPRNYPGGRDCYWTIHVPQAKRIRFQFATLQLEHHENCSFDYLRIFDGSRETDPVLQTYCTTSTPGPLLTSGSSALLHFHSDPWIADTGFHITYAAVPGIPGCGGILTSPRGTVSSPNFPDVYDNQLNCEWLIRIHPGDRIELEFKDFNTEYHRNCRFDYVEVYDGSDDAAPILGRYCGRDIRAKLISNSNVLFIKFRTDSSVQLNGFRAEYRTVCGGYYTSLEGSFTSPYYPEPYPNTANCYYHIALPLGYLIYLRFQVFSVEHGSECNYDYVEVRDGDSEQANLVGKFCGHASPDPVVSSYNQLWIKFHTDGHVQNQGFYANYTNIHVGCGGVVTTDRGFIGTPRHPSYYPPSVTCTWVLRAPPGHVVRLTFETFVMESHPQCNFDYVLVQDTGGAKIGKYCSETPPILTSTGNEMLVTFAADDTVSREGFNASYVFLDASQTCGGHFYLESGVVRSPRYPETYPNSMRCIWVLHAENGHQIVLNVTSFHLERDADCEYDYLEIRNGAFATSPLIGRFCGQTIPQVFKSHSNTMRLAFHSDRSLSAPGFEIFYNAGSTGCGTTERTPQGSIVSPNYPQPYGHNAECSWLIKASAGSIISVVIIDIDIEEHTTCMFDYLEIFDGPDDRSRSLIRMCNNQQNPGPVKSSDNSLFVKFKTDMSGSGRGFHLSYHSLCNNVLRKRRGVIESPNFPNSYPHNHNCTWNITAPAGSNISLAFSHLFMENVTSCEADYVSVSEMNQDGVNQVAKYCGTPFPLPPPLEVASNIAIVRMVTDAYLSREGFRLEWTFKGCGGDLVKTHGEITSPNYPNGYPHTTDCYWTIRYPIGKRVQLSITDFDLEASRDCFFDYLKVYGGEDETAPELLKLCHKISQPQTLTSHGNHMTVHFHSDFSVAGKGFRAVFVALQMGCGGTYTAVEATIMSPYYPSRYNANDECDWLIKIDKTHLVSLEFYEFSLPDAPNCTKGSVTIYDGRSSSAPVMAKLCGEKPANPVFNSTGNSMLVRLKGDGINVGNGFKAHYKSGCGQRLVADDGGELLSPNYPHASVDYQNCSWIITSSSPEEKVMLSFTFLMTSTEDCTSGRSFGIEIRDGDRSDSPVINRYCGSRVPAPVISHGNSLYVNSNRHAIFRAVYGITSSFCGGDYTAAEGYFASPDYPDDYPMDTECVWTIQASAGSLIQVTFQMFDIEDSDYCNTDYVEIHENDASGPLIGRFCGNTIPSNRTTGSKLWIKFRSDPYGTGAGFLAYYAVVHGTHLNGTEGIIESPGYPHSYHLSGQYDWTVTVPESYTVSVQFLVMEIHPADPGRTCYVSVMIFDGFDETAPELGQFCGYERPEPVQSHGNQVMIRFSGPDYLVGMWRLRWVAVNHTVAVPQHHEVNASSCWQEILLNASSPVHLTSGAYPSGYEPNLNCTWLYRASSYEHIRITFEDVHLEGEANSCLFDRVEVYTAPLPYVDNWELNTTLCGRVTNQVVEVPNNVVKIVFITDAYLAYRGFSAVVETACGGVITGESGSLKSSDLVSYLTQYHSSQTAFTCEWVISVRTRRTLQITFSNFNLPSDGACSNMYIMILNGGRRESPRLGYGKYCGTIIPSVHETSSNKALVTLKLNSFSRGSPQFTLRFTEISTACGGYLFLTEDDDNIDVESPNYPHVAPHPMECTWIIMSPSGTRMRIDIADGFYLSGDCYSGENLEYIQVLDGGSETAEPLARYCGTEHPSSAMTSGNAVYITYVTQAEGHEAGGFKANIRIAECGGTYFNYYGVLTSPNYPENYSSSLECEWILKVMPDYDITIMIRSIDTPSAGNCTLTDYLEIRAPDKDGELFGVFCGNSETQPNTYLTLPGSQAYVKFKSDSSLTGKGFMLNFRQNHYTCGGEYNAPSGVITSPGYPEALTSARECMWRITAKEGRVVTLEFTEFSLPRDEITGVCISSLTILESLRGRRDGTKLCGNALPQPKNTDTGYVNLHLSTHGLAAGQGFSLTYSTETESICGGILPTPSGVLSTPNFTLSNKSVIECRWKLETERNNQTVVFKFDVLDIPGHMANYCSDSLLSFYIPRGNFWARFCGNMTSRRPVVTSPFAATAVRFYARGLLDKPFGGFYATYNVSDCGGVIDASDAVITSPGYPDGYPPNIYCHWLLSVRSSERVKITVLDMQLEENCKNDYVLIRNGYRSNSPSIGKFCGRQQPAPIISDTWHVSIIFHSDEYGSAPGFKITTAEVEHGCGGIVHAANGVIMSPNYPSHYGNDQECVWTIELSPGSVVNATFVDRFDIEMERTCSKDYIVIEDYDQGVWKQVRKACGRENPGTVLSSSTKMRITFHSDSQTPGDGFKIRYSAACGGHFTDKVGVVLSPNYPEEYPNNLDCKYIIGDPQHYVSLIFDSESFSIEVDASCSYDAVEVYEGNTTASTIRGTYCGTDAPPPLLFSGQALVRFRTDGSYAAHGFLLHYEVTECGGILTDAYGRIHTPKKPEGYLHNMQCSWVIQGQENRVIAIRFVYFGLESAHGCVFDNLKIYDGNSSGRLLGKLCGAELPPMIKSNGSLMTLTFTSDGSVSGQGFELVYYNTFGVPQNCGGTQDAATGEFSSLDFDKDGKYEPNLDCLWKLVGSADQVLRITFTQFDVESSGNDTCQYDYVEIRDGLFSNDPVIGRYCGDSIPPPIIASSNKVSVLFHSDDKENRQGFRATFSSVPGTCGARLLAVSDAPQTLTSPGFPSPYPSNLYCRWHFTFDSPYKSLLQIKFTEMDIPCGGDYLEVHSSFSDMHPYRLCGPSHPHSFVASDLWLAFYSDDSGGGKGFSLTYGSAPCDRNYTRDNGAIASLWLYHPSSTRNCSYLVETTPGRTISLYFGQFYFPQESGTTDCSLSNMKVYDGETTSRTSVATLCGAVLPHPIFSTGNKLLISVNILRSYPNYAFFMSYTTTDKGRGCGGTLTHANGTFSSPLYPEPYSVTGECEWRLSVPGRHTMMLYFDFFALSSTSGCETNFVELYDSPEAIPSKRVRIMCGDETPAPYHSQGSQLLVKLVTNSSNTQPGFVARFAANAIEQESSHFVVQASESSGAEYEEENGVVYMSRSQ